MFRNAESLSLSIWYFESWASQLMTGHFKLELALELSKALRDLMANEHLSNAEKNDLASISCVIHKQLVSRVQGEGEACVSGSTYTIRDAVNEANALLKACKVCKYLRAHFHQLLMRRTGKKALPSTTSRTEIRLASQVFDDGGDFDILIIDKLFPKALGL